VRLEGFGQLKNPMISPGIETATFQLVAQCLNQLRYCVLLNDFEVQTTTTDNLEAKLPHYELRGKLHHAN
jgi:hypothetical protein